MSLRLIYFQLKRFVSVYDVSFGPYQLCFFMTFQDFSSHFSSFQTPACKILFRIFAVQIKLYFFIPFIRFNIF